MVILRVKDPQKPVQVKALAPDLQAASLTTSVRPGRP